jgi:hypothetical protein
MLLGYAIGNDLNIWSLHSQEACPDVLTFHLVEKSQVFLLALFNLETHHHHLLKLFGKVE